MTTRHGPASMTVTGVSRVSSSICVMPSFLPSNPLVINDPLRSGECHTQCGRLGLTHSEFNFNIDAGSEIQLHEGVHRFRSRLHDIHQTLVRSDFKLLTRLFIRMRRPLNRKFLNACRQRNWTHDFRTAAANRFDDFRNGLIQHAIIEPTQPNSDSLIDLDHAIPCSSVSYARISVTTPEPTVLPPSRTAKRNPWSIAIGLINSAVTLTLSPGITISTPGFNDTTPVTSVVRK